MRKQPLSPEKALVRLEQLCARSEQAIGEIAEKLRRWNIPPSEAEKIIRSLCERRFVDDKRFAAAYVRDKVNIAHWGRAKIHKGLIAKRIAHDIIKDAIAEIDMEKYSANLKSLIEREIIGAGESISSYEVRTKIFRHLIARGYETSLASTMLTEALTAIF